MKPTAVDPFHDVASSPRRWTRRAGPLGNQRSKVVEENPSESFFCSMVMVATSPSNGNHISVRIFSGRK